jgi:hypothetical protein
VIRNYSARGRQALAASPETVAAFVDAMAASKAPASARRYFGLHPENLGCTFWRYYVATATTPLMMSNPQNHSRSGLTGAGTFLSHCRKAAAGAP